MRKHWIDNLRWTTVLLVLLYHVFYFYNNKGVFGGIGGFGDGPQYQDVIMYILYPWFMPLLFILAGISAKYALKNHKGKEWFKSRTRKLLVPATIGLFVFHWMTGYFNTAVAARTGMFDGMPMIAKYCMMAVSGTGPLWFIQDLWLFSLFLLLLRSITKNCKFESLKKRLHTIEESPFLPMAIVLLGVLFWIGERTLVFNPRPESLDGLWNLYKPLFYIIPFLLGYYIFSRESVQNSLSQGWIVLMAIAALSGVILVFLTFGQDNTLPQYLASPLNCIYGWLMCLAMMSWFKTKFDKTNAFAGYMTRSSYGLYIVHYLVIASLGYMMKLYTSLPPVAIYIILTVAVFTLSPLLYEILHRIPFLRWCIFGERKKKNSDIICPKTLLFTGVLLLLFASCDKDKTKYEIHYRFDNTTMQSDFVEAYELTPDGANGKWRSTYHHLDTVISNGDTVEWASGTISDVARDNCVALQIFTSGWRPCGGGNYTLDTIYYLKLGENNIINITPEQTWTPTYGN